MNKQSLLMIIIWISSLALVGCNKSGKLNKASTFSPPPGPVELKQKWPVGECIVQSYAMKMNMETSIPNQPNPIKQEMVMGQDYGLTVMRDNPDGGHELEMEFLALRMKMDQAGKNAIDYDSAHKPSNDRKNPAFDTIEKMFQGIIGGKIRYFLDTSNDVTRIEGIDELKNRLMSSGPQNAAANYKEMLNGMVNPDYFKRVVESCRYLPAQPVRPGDTWPVHMDIAMGGAGTMVINDNFTFQRWETYGKRICARLEFDGTVKSQPVGNSLPSGMTMQVQDGHSLGVLWFDPELGIVIDLSENQNLTMAISMPVKIRGQAVTQTIKTLMHQTIDMKLESVK